MKVRSSGLGARLPPVPCQSSLEGETVVELVDVVSQRESCDHAVGSMVGLRLLLLALILAE